MVYLTSIVLCLLVFSSQCFSYDEPTRDECTDLHVGVLLEYSRHPFSNNIQFFADLFQHVADDIAKRKDILQGFRLKLHVRDTKANNGLAGKLMFDLMENGEPKVAIIGPIKSASLEVTGQIAAAYNVIVLSFIALSSDIRNIELFPTLFKVNQDFSVLNPLRIKLMEYFGWKRAGIIAFDDDVTLPQMKQFGDHLVMNNMTIAWSGVYKSIAEIPEIISKFKVNGVRIIFAAIKHGEAASVFCEAYRQGLYGKSFVWIITGGILYDGWIQASNHCTKEEVLAATDGSLVLLYQKASSSAEPSITGLSAKEEIASVIPTNATIPYAWLKQIPWVMDTMWTLAIGLNNSIKYLREKGLSLHNYTNSPDFLEAIQKGTNEASFQGISGPFSFDNTNNRIGLTYLQRSINESDENTIVTYDQISDSLTWNIEPSSIWSDGNIPKDDFIYKEHPTNPNVPLAVSIATVNSFGCLICIGFLAFNIIFRHKWSIRMSSPHVNSVILIGCLCMYVVVYVSTVEYLQRYEDGTKGSVCMAKTWLIATGYTLMFGGMFAKTYRVYIIFKNTTVKRKPIKDHHLFIVVGILLIIDFIILIPWTTVFPFSSEKQIKMMDTLDNNLIDAEVIVYCHNTKQVYWFITMYVYKGLLLAFGTFLAWETRNVTVEELNDSRNIGACIYSVVVVCLIGVPLQHILPTDQINPAYVLETCILLFSTTTCACVIFLPKIHNRNKVRERMLTKPATALSTKNCACSGHPSNLNVVLPGTSMDSSHM